MRRLLLTALLVALALPALAGSPDLSFPDATCDQWHGHERYTALGGTIELIRKPGVGHHPHGLDDPTPIVEFLVRHAGAPSAAAPTP
jgi:hypothetical protein